MSSIPGPAPFFETPFPEISAIFRSSALLTADLALGLLLSLAMSAGAHVGDRLYPIAYLSEEMLAQIQLHDGRIDEWYELLGEPTLTLLDFAPPFLT